MSIMISIVFVAEGDVVVFQLADARVVDGGFVGISRQVTHHGLCFFKMGFAVNHPVMLHELIEGGIKAMSDSAECPRLVLLAQAADHGPLSFDPFNRGAACRVLWGLRVRDP